MTDKELSNILKSIHYKYPNTFLGSEEMVSIGLACKMAAERIERLQSERDNAIFQLTRLKAEVNQYKEFKNYFDSLYGQGLEVANWHLNGSLEPFDNFFDSAVDEMECEQ